MLKDKIKSKKPLPKRRAKKNDDKQQPVDIFKLISSIPKQEMTFSPFPYHKSNMIYAEALLKFCEEKIPDKIQHLTFNRSQSLGNLIYELTEIIIKEKFTITYHDTFVERPIVDFEYRRMKYDWHWYIMEAKHLSKIKAKEMKVGFCHLMRMFGKQTTEVSFIQHSHKEFTDTIDPIDGDYFESCYDGGEFDNPDYDGLDTFEEFQQFVLKPYQDCKAEYDELIALPIELFHNYQPKNKPEEKLKKLLEEGLKMDFSIIHRFPDDEEVHTDDGSLVSYSDSFMLVYDWDSIVEENMMTFYNSNANECGVTVPVNYDRWKDGKIHDGPSEQEEQHLLDVCKFLTNLSIFFD